MSRLADLERAVRDLSAEELRAFREWFLELEHVQRFDGGEESLCAMDERPLDLGMTWEELRRLTREP